MTGCHAGGKPSELPWTTARCEEATCFITNTWGTIIHTSKGVELLISLER